MTGDLVRLLNAPSFGPPGGHAVATHESYAASRPPEESEMPKMKTKSGAKKRFKFTATGKSKKRPGGQAATA